MKHLVEDLTSEEIRTKAEEGAVIVVPVGAHEQHGDHLPVKTDWALVKHIAEASARQANDSGIHSLVTPAIWTGFSPHHMHYPGTVTVRSTTLLALLRDVATSLWAHGFRRILLLNGHGGNSNLLGLLCQDLHFEDDVRVATANYWALALDEIKGWRASPVGGINHACEMETSLMMALDGSAVRARRVADSETKIRSRFFSNDLTHGGPVATSWRFEELSQNGTIGMPSFASAERGRQLLDLIIDRVTDLLVEMSAWDWTNPLRIASGSDSK